MSDWYFRLRYFCLHLLLSIILAIISLSLIFIVWFPRPLAEATGISQIVILMLGIDLVLGPLMTLILAKQGKRGLKFDLFIVLCLQFGALSYGLYSISISRPTWIVFYVDAFDLMQANNMQPQGISNKDYQSNPWFGYQYRYISKPKNDEERLDRIEYNLKTGFGPTQRSEMFQPLIEGWVELSNQQRSLEELKKINNEIDLTQAPYSLSTGWLPLRASQSSKVILINIRQKKVVKIVDINPYPSVKYN